MKTTVKRLYSSFEKAKESIENSIKRYIVDNDNGTSKDPTIYIDHERLFNAQTICINKQFLPTSLFVYNDMVCMTYFNYEEVDEYGFKDSDEYEDLLSDFSFDELYYIIECIENYKYDKK